MLTTLRIKNLALVTDLTLELQPGCNVITGETGAGKSIIIGALNLVLGERADRSLIRSGEDSCSVEAVFDVAKCSISLTQSAQRPQRIFLKIFPLRSSRPLRERLPENSGARLCRPRPAAADFGFPAHRERLRTLRLVFDTAALRQALKTVAAHLDRAGKARRRRHAPSIGVEIISRFRDFDYEDADYDEDELREAPLHLTSFPVQFAFPSLQFFQIACAFVGIVTAKDSLEVINLQPSHKI